MFALLVLSTLENMLLITSKFLQIRVQVNNCYTSEYLIDFFCHLKTSWLCPP